MTGICPCCGYNLAADSLTERSGWRIEPAGGVWYQGRRIPLRRPERGILLALARAPDSVSRIALLNRISSSENDNLLSVYVTRTRNALRDLGIPVPFETVPRQGYRWIADELAEAA